MGIEVKRKQGESASALMFNFSKRIKRSGVLKEARRRLFYARTVSRIKRKASALQKDKKKKEIDRARKLGIA
ncbi:MAG: 30S ribosomal protein S21 [Patescibacteria group bacterium]